MPPLPARRHARLALRRTPPVRPSTALGPGWLALAGGLAIAGCLAPRPSGEEHTLADFAARLQASETKPVESESATVVAAAMDLPEGAEEGEPDPYSLADPDEVELPAPQDPVEVPENPYLRFGERIQVNRLEDGTQIITKPFNMPVGKANRMVELMTVLQPFPFRVRAVAEVGADAAPADPNVVEVVVIEKWDFENYGNLVAYPPTAAAAVEIGDLFIVTATSARLAQVEDFINLFAAGIPQIEIEAKIIEITEADTIDIGVRPVDGDTPTFQSGTANFIKSLTIDLPNSVATDALLTIGGIHDGVSFNMLIEAVKTWQNVSIESKPKTVVRAGGVARIESTTSIPYYKITGINTNGNFTASVEYKDVGVKLYISPRVLGPKSLALDVHLEGSQVIANQPAFIDDQGNAFTIPVIAARTAKTVVYLEPGQTLVIGGLTQESTTDVVNKVPVLGDIPLIGLLFRSTFKQVRKEHVLFAISPRIVQHAEFQDF